jgi:hypothetical protein
VFYIELETEPAENYPRSEMTILVTLNQPFSNLCSVEFFPRLKYFTESYPVFKLAIYVKNVHK